jgi:uncharacterized membrane protein
MTTQNSAPPPLVEQNIRAVEQLHSEHHESATPIERVLERLKVRITGTGFVVVVAAMVSIWLAANIVLRHTPWAFDPPPFAYLDTVLQTFAAMVTILILSTQRRADKLAAHREQLILQLVMSSEQKTAKIIALLEELRRDSPQVTDRTDHEAAEMSEAADALAVSQALRDVDETGAGDVRIAKDQVVRS